MVYASAPQAPLLSVSERMTLSNDTFALLVPGYAHDHFLDARDRLFYVFLTVSDKWIVRVVNTTFAWRLPFDAAPVRHVSAAFDRHRGLLLVSDGTALSALQANLHIHPDRGWAPEKHGFAVSCVRSVAETVLSVSGAARHSMVMFMSNELMHAMLGAL